MVFLIQKSNINQQLFPVAYEWDSLVRKHYNQYQKLIDAQAYQLQRIQRYFLKLKYPQAYDSDLVTLNLLEKKQQVGEVTKSQLQLYRNIDPCARTYFNRTFNSSSNFPVLGGAIGAASFAYGTAFKFSLIFRFAVLALPIFVDSIRISRDVKSEIQTTQFLDWVIAYRKARTFNQRHRDHFTSPQTRKVIGNNNMVELGKNLVRLASQE